MSLVLALMVFTFVLVGLFLLSCVLGCKLVDRLANERKAIIKDIATNGRDEVCNMCEELILGCSRNTWYFQCEGGRCEEAIDMFVEDRNLLELRESK